MPRPLPDLTVLTMEDTDKTNAQNADKTTPTKQETNTTECPNAPLRKRLKQRGLLEYRDGCFRAKTRPFGPRGSNFQYFKKRHNEVQYIANELNEFIAKELNELFKHRRTLRDNLTRLRRLLTEMNNRERKRSPLRRLQRGNSF
tara:strand:- start:322 stop:753 length:432 start_codon:yes stop_codon:yes gene_type:complete